MLAFFVQKIFKHRFCCFGWPTVMLTKRGESAHCFSNSDVSSTLLSGLASLLGQSVAGSSLHSWTSNDELSSRMVSPAWIESWLVSQYFAVLQCTVPSLLRRTRHDEFISNSLCSRISKSSGLPLGADSVSIQRLSPFGEFSIPMVFRRLTPNVIARGPSSIFRRVGGQMLFLLFCQSNGCVDITSQRHVSN
jgi:hypothetical protein